LVAVPALQAVKDNAAKWHVDIWPLIMQPGGGMQHSYEMLLQLGNIVHMVHRWNKYTTLRVMFFVEKVRRDARLLLAESFH